MVEVRLEGYPQVWRVGYEVLDLKVALGQGRSGTTVSVTLADPGHLIGAAIIRHVQDNGGITALPGDSTPATGTNGANPATGPTQTPSQWEAAIIAECRRQGVQDPGQIAYILATAKHESGNFVYTREIWGPTAAQLSYEGRSDLGNNQPGDGKRYMGRGLVQITGRRNYTEYSKILGVDAVGQPELLEQPKYALFTLVHGSRTGTFTGRKVADYISGEKRDFIGARAVINGNDQASLIAGYAQDYLKSGKIGAAVASQPVPKDPVATTTPEAATPEVVKGSKLTVTDGDIVWEFYHQGTDVNHEGETSLSGQGIRWILNRRKRSKTLGTTSLKGLAQAIATAHRVKLEWSPAYDIFYTHVDQTGVSDYTLLVRECDRAGLFVSEKAGTLTIKDLKAITDTSLVLMPGNNLVSWTVTDRPLDPNGAEAATADLPEENKVTLDPLTGTLAPKVADKDPVADPSSTGKPLEPATGTLAPGQDAIAQAGQARMKRLKGLPSTFTIPLSERSKALEPMQAVQTQGLPGVLARMWAIDVVTHDYRAATTTLQCYSPVEVAVVDQPAPDGAAGPVDANTPPGRYIYPCRGFPVTDIIRWRPNAGRMHWGIDVGCPTGTPIVASNSGTVSYTGNDPGGYGLWVEVSHPDGWKTRYAHLSSIGVSNGARVARGGRVGISGDTGVGTGAHLHVEWRNPSGAAKPPEELKGSGLSAKVGQVW